MSRRDRIDPEERVELPLSECEHALLLDAIVIEVELAEKLNAAKVADG